MKKAVFDFLNIILTFAILIIVIYVSFFTNLPTEASNEIKQKIEEAQYEYKNYSSDFIINDLTINMNTYYYEKLTDDQKKIYESIANGVKNFRSEFSVLDYNPQDKDNFAQETAVAIEAFINDHPEVYYLKSEYSTYIVEGINENIGYIKINYTEETYEAVEEKNKIIKSVIDEYVQEFSNLESDYAKEIAVHDKLAYSVTYSDLEDLPRKYHTVEGTLIEKTGVCDSFTKSLQLIYNELGIDSIIVLGQTSGGPHAWNLVKIENEWYHVDLTSARSIYDETGIVNHAYFNITDEKILQTNQMDTPELLPSATSTKYNYYVYNDLIVSDNLAEKLKEIYYVDEENDYIEFYLEGDVSDKISDILKILKTMDSSFVKDSKMYYYNIQNAIIIPKN